MGSTGGTPKVGVTVQGTTSVVEGAGNLFKKEMATAKGSTTVAGVQVGGKVSGPSISIDGSAKGHVGMDGVDIKVNASIDANLASANANGRKTFRVEVGGQSVDVTLDLQAAGNVGANGKIALDVHIGTDGTLNISAGVSGFAGARASLGGSITVSSGGRVLASGSANLTAYAGAAASASFHAGFDHGDVKFEAKAAAAVGVGMGLDIKGDINVANTAEFGAKVLEGLAGQGLHSAEKWIGDHIPTPHWPWSN